MGQVTKVQEQVLPPLPVISAPKRYTRQEFVAEFIKRHEKSLKNGGFFGIFSRTTLVDKAKPDQEQSPYQQLNSNTNGADPISTAIAKIELHAAKGTFFGGNNRTRQILIDMGYVAKNSKATDQVEIPESSFRNA